MAYKPNQSGPIRDECYPSKIAADRPALATRLTWEAENEDMNRGSDAEDVVARFNRELRAGHANRNAGEE